MRTTATFDQIYQEFFQEHQVTPGSLKTYKNCLNIFIHWCDRNKRNKRMIIVPDIRDYLDYIQKNYTLNFSSLLIHVLKSFFRWLQEKGYYEDVTLKIKAPRKDYSYKKISLTEDQVEKLLSTFKLDTLKEKRDYAIISLMLVQGVRCVEISRMNPDDFRDIRGQKCMMIQRKGQTTKSSLISVDPVYSFIAEYTGHPEYKSKESLFASLQSGQRLTPISVGLIVNSWLEKSNIKSKMITPHSLRHTAAQTMIKNGCTMEELQIQFGHGDRSITRIYTQYMDNELLIRNTGGKKNFETFFGKSKDKPSIYFSTPDTPSMVHKCTNISHNSNNDKDLVTGEKC